MKAMIFAAGLGTRLRPLTDDRPKALVEVDGKPLVWHVIQRLRQAGFSDIVVNVHHFADLLTSYLMNNDFGVRIHISDERNLLLETGGGIRHAAPFFDDGKPFLVHNVDIFSNADLHLFYLMASTNPHGATLLVSERPSSRSLLFDRYLRLRGWINHQTGETKPPQLQTADLEPYAFSGIHVFSPELFSEMKSWPERFSIIDFYLSLAASDKVRAVFDKNMKLIDVGKIDNLRQASEFLRTAGSNPLSDQFPNVP
ncbi:MAG: nucleotidyltransferase family protein [Paludibacteraceae bacterium]|nr:nucleotidyltransferase family protein [Paludibacteraceae bacterium]